MDSERIPRSLLRGLASELQSIDIFLAWKIPCTLVQGASIFWEVLGKDILHSLEIIEGKTAVHVFITGEIIKDSP